MSVSVKQRLDGSPRRQTNPRARRRRLRPLGGRLLLDGRRRRRARPARAGRRVGRQELPRVGQERERRPLPVDVAAVLALALGVEVVAQVLLVDRLALAQRAGEDAVLAPDAVDWMQQGRRRVRGRAAADGRQRQEARLGSQAEEAGGRDAPLSLPTLMVVDGMCSRRLCDWTLPAVENHWTGSQSLQAQLNSGDWFLAELDGRSRC